MSLWSGLYRRRGRRPPPEHGIKVKQAGTTWWSQRWIQALERLSRGYASRLTRGYAYARAGRVHDLEISAGEITARVTGSRVEPYRVEIRIPLLDDAAWQKVIGALASEAGFTAELLAGQVPQDIERALKVAGVSLFPRREQDLETSCSCPDWANPCKHVAATHYVIAEALDKDPFLLFELKGRGRDALLGELWRHQPGKRALTEKEETALPAEPIRSLSLAGTAVEDFERPRGPLRGLHFHFEPPVHPALLLQQLGEPASGSAGVSVADVLAPLYEAAGRLARELALGAAESVRTGAPHPLPTRAPGRRRKRAPGTPRE